MQARLVGFYWTFPKGFGIAHLLQAFRERTGVRFMYDAHFRRFYVEDHNEYLLGFLLSEKDHEKLTSLKANEEGEVTSVEVGISDLGADTRIFDFNFVVIHKTSGACAYLQHRGSCPSRTFVNYCKSLFRTIKDEAKHATEKAYSVRTVRERKEALAKYQGAMKSAPIIRQEKLAKLMKKFARISKFEFDTVTPVAEKSMFSPLSGDVRRQVRTYLFSAKPVSTVKKIRRTIFNVIERLGITKAKVEGVDEHGDPRVYQLVDNADVFQKYDFADLVVPENLTLKNLSLCPIMEKILEVIDANKAVFEA